MTDTATVTEVKLPDTPRPLPNLLALFADNHAGAITPQDSRDLVVSGPLRSPADWLYLVGASAIAGSLAFPSATRVNLNVVDLDGVDRTAQLAALATPGAILRLVNFASSAYMVLQVEGASLTGAIWTFDVLVLTTSGTFTIGSLASASIMYPQLSQSPGTVYAASNKAGVLLPAGCALAVHSSGNGVVLADPTSSALAAVGLAQVDIGIGFTGTVQTGGLLNLVDWTAATGSPALATRGRYFLSIGSPGQISTAIPSGAGNILQEIGTAVSAQILRLEFGIPYLL